MRIVLDFAEMPGRVLRRHFSRPVEVLRADSLEQIEAVLTGLERAKQRHLHAVGFLSYEASPALDLAARVHSGEQVMPLAWFGLFREPEPGIQLDYHSNPVTSDWVPDWEYSEYERRVATLKDAISNGEIYQANLTLPFRSRLLAGSPMELYERLRLTQGGDYCAFIDCDEFQLLSLSPELFFSRRGMELEMRPMKGTAAPEGVCEDRRTLPAIDSEKNHAENLMIVDLIRNDLGRVAIPGSVRVPDLFTIESYPTVVQMTSTVRATMRPNTSTAELIRAVFPSGSITGAPKIRAMEWISRLESVPRGPYCGTIGWLKPDGNAVFNVAIRTLAHDPGRGNLVCGLGGGIVWDSDPACEWEEIATKGKFLTASSESFGLLETIRVDDGCAELQEQHFERLQRSARELEFHQPIRSDFVGLLRGFSEQYPNGCYRARLKYQRNGRYHLEGFVLTEDSSRNVQVALAREPVNSLDPMLRHKISDRSFYRHYWQCQSADCFDILLWNERGELTEFTKGNLVVKWGGKLLTPPLSSGLLPGTRRQLLLNDGVVREAVITKQELDNLESMWFVNSIRGWVRVSLAHS